MDWIGLDYKSTPVHYNLTQMDGDPLADWLNGWTGVDLVDIYWISIGLNGWRSNGLYAKTAMD
jgi:hypothetical protein